LLRWLILDLNSFFASCEEQEDEALRGKPVIVVPTMAETTCAIAASYPAKKLGIKTGTLVYEARRICPEIKIVPAKHKLYVEYHHRILKAIDRHIPIDDVMSIDEVACRLDRTQQEPEAARRLALAIKREIAMQVGECLTSSIGIAANKLLAKLASNMQKPDGLVLLHPAEMPGAILHLALRDIPGIGPNMEERLQRAGIGDIRTLMGLDAARLRAVWGSVVGVRMHGLLHGEDIVSPKTRRSSISHQHVLAPLERNREAAASILRQLLIRAAQRVRDDGFYCRAMYVEAKWQGRQSGYWSAKTRFQESRDTAFLLQVLQGLWRKAPDLKPLRIGVALGGLTAAAAHQPDLFDRPKNAKLIRAVDALNAKFGKGAITYGSAAPQMISKIAFQRVPELKEF
jgi:DNA polymerase-4